jgi:hypothetical protein
MLTQLFPRDHQRYSKSSVADWLEDFAKWLSEDVTRTKSLTIV